jgi:hypothetical protein
LEAFKITLPLPPLTKPLVPTPELVIELLKVKLPTPPTPQSKLTDEPISNAPLNITIRLALLFVKVLAVLSDLVKKLAALVKVNVVSEPLLALKNMEDPELLELP